ncbi:MAG: hypothetical protein GY839_03655 [candidate division Zixibacteria bacterium]|nr:hypothetical protein [candidate division Zixibacteria bacterium]
MDVMKTLNAVVLHNVDCEKGEGIDLANEFKVRGYPTWVLVDSNREPIARWSGYEKDFFIETMAEVMADLSPIHVKADRFEKEPTLADALAVAKYNANASEYKSAVEYYTKTQELDKDNDYSYDIFENTARGVRGELFTYDDAVRAGEIVFVASNAENKILTASTMSTLARRAERPDEMAKYLERGIDVEVAEDDEHALRNQKRLKIDYNLHVTGDSLKAIELKKTTYDEGWTESPSRLNSFAWWCFENLVNLEEAETLSRKAVELSEPGSDRAQILDTVAQICKARGKLDEAIEVMKQAVADDPNNKSYSETLAEFESELAEG